MALNLWPILLHQTQMLIYWQMTSLRIVMPSETNGSPLWLWLLAINRPSLPLLPYSPRPLLHMSYVCGAAPPNYVCGSVWMAFAFSSHNHIKTRLIFVKRGRLLSESDQNGHHSPVYFIRGIALMFDLTCFSYTQSTMTVKSEPALHSMNSKSTSYPRIFKCSCEPLQMFLRNGWRMYPSSHQEDASRELSYQKQKSLLLSVKNEVNASGKSTLRWRSLRRRNGSPV